MLEKIKNKAISALRWSEQYTKTDMVYLAKGGFWTWLGKGVQIITGTAMAVAFANLLPKEVYGNYKYILSVAGVLGAFTLNGLTSSITRSAARGYEGSLQQGAKETFKWSIFIVMAALAVAGYYFWQGNALLGSGMLLIAAFQPVIKTASLYQAHLFGKRLFKIESIYLIIWEITQITLIVGALFLTNNPLVLIAILFALNTFFAGFFLYQTIKKYVNNQKTEEGFLSYGKHLSLMGILSAGARYADKALIFQMLGAVPTAIYSFALLPTEKLDGMLRSVNKIVLPKFSEKPLEKLQETVSRKIGVALIVSILIVFLLITSLPTIFSLLFPEYMDSVIYAQWLAAGLIFVPEILFQQALIAHVQKRALYIINISGNLLKLSLLVILIPFYGIWGAVYAFISFYAFRFLAKATSFYTASPVESTGSGSTQ